MVVYKKTPSGWVPVSPSKPSAPTSSGGSSSKSSIVPTPIYRDGKLVGVDDPIQKVSRLPTPSETLIWNKQPSTSSGGSSSYNPVTKTYTDAYGNKMSMAPEYAQQAEAQARQQELQRQQELARQQEAQRLAEQQRQATEQQRQQTMYGGYKSGITEVKDYRPTTPLPPIQTQPYIEKRVVDTFKDPETGKQIPVSEVVYVDPTGIGEQKERKATPEEVDYYYSQTKELEIVPLTKTEKLASRVGLYPEYKTAKQKVFMSVEKVGEIKYDIQTGIGKIEPSISSSIRERFPEEQSIKQRQDIIGSTEFLRQQSRQSTQTLIDLGVPSIIAKGGGYIADIGIYSGGLIAGGVGSTAEKTIEKPITYPLKFATIEALTTGVGFGISGIITGTKAGVTGLFGAKIGTAVGIGLKTAITGTGIYFGAKYIAEVERKIVTAPSVFERGGILFETGFETASALVGFKTGAKAFSKVDPFTKITEIKPMRDVKIPEFTEKSYTVVTKGKEINLAKYLIRGEKTPPLLKTETTAFRKFFGMQPKTTTIIPPKYYTVQTLYPAVYGKPFLVTERTLGTKYFKIKTISGTTESVNVRIDNLNKLDKFLLQRYAESITGKPMSAKQVDKFFFKKSDFTRSVIESYKLTDINLRDKTLKIFSDTGRRTDLNLAMTRTKPSFKTEKVEVFTSETFFKDISKLFSRATGKTPQLKGTIYQLIDPIILDTAPVKFIKPSPIIKTPFSKTFLQTKQVEQLIKYIPKLDKIPIPPKTAPVTAPPTSIFAGLGLYERTDRGYTSGLVTEQQQILSTRITPDLKFGKIEGVSELKTLQVPEIKMIEELKQDNVLKLKTGLKISEKLKEMQKIKEIQKVKEVQKQMQKIKEIQKVKEVQKQMQKIKEIQKLKTALKPITFLKLPKLPPTRIAGGVSPFKREKPLLRQVETFGVFVKRKGKFAPIGTELTLSQAMRLGGERVSTTLARTFKVRPMGKKRDIFAIDEIGEPDPFVFREFKVRRGERIPTPRQFIERSKFALSTPTEKREIQIARQQTRELNKIINM